MSVLALYKFTGDKKQLIKLDSLELIELISGEFREDINVLKPVVFIQPTELSTVNKIIKEVNYVEIADFGRYYFVDDIIAKNGTIIELHLSVDVLYTYQSHIKLIADGIVARNAQVRNSNLFLDDSEIHIYNNPNLQTYTFNYAANSLQFGQPAFVLAVAGS